MKQNVGANDIYGVTSISPQGYSTEATMPIPFVKEAWMLTHTITGNRNVQAGSFTTASTSSWNTSGFVPDHLQFTGE